MKFFNKLLDHGKRTLLTLYNTKC